MKYNKYFFIFLFSCFTITSYGSICTSKANNDWTKSATWNCSAPFTTPGCPDTIIINHIVVIDDQINLTACGPIYIIVNGTLDFKNGKKLYLADGSLFIVNTGGLLDPGTGGGSSNLINIGGNDVWIAADGPKSGPITYYTGGVLPIKLLEFTANSNVDKVDIKWITTNEVNNNYFTIEKSKDALTWEVVLQTQGAGNSNVNIEYFESDYNPYEGVSYYRLKQTDFDGNFEYFNIVPVKVDLSNKGEMNLFPNPLRRGEELKINLEGIKQDVLIVIRDAKGQEFYSKAQIHYENNQLIAVPINLDIPAGFYIVTASSENQIYSQKLLIK